MREARLWHEGNDPDQSQPRMDSIYDEEPRPPQVQLAVIAAPTANRATGPRMTREEL